MWRVKWCKYFHNKTQGKIQNSRRNRVDCYHWNSLPQFIIALLNKYIHMNVYEACKYLHICSFQIDVFTFIYEKWLKKNTYFELLFDGKIRRKRIDLIACDCFEPCEMPSFFVPFRLDGAFSFLSIFHPFMMYLIQFISAYSIISLCCSFYHFSLAEKSEASKWTWI